MWAAITGALSAAGEAIVGAASAAMAAISLPVLILICIVVAGCIVAAIVYAH